MARDFHLNYDRQLDKIRVKSYGGGSPRWVAVHLVDSDGLTRSEISGLSLEDARSLRYLLDRLIALTDED